MWATPGKRLLFGIDIDMPASEDQCSSEGPTVFWSQLSFHKIMTAGGGSLALPAIAVPVKRVRHL